MAVRQTAVKRSPNNTSFSKRKVAPSTSDVYVHSLGNDDQKSSSPRSFKEEKFDTGMLALKNHDYVEAVKQFSLIKPDTPKSLYHCGCARLELKHYAQAEEAIVDLTKCIELAEQSDQPILEVWYKRAVAFYDVHQHDEAIKDYTEYIDRCRALGEKGDSKLCRGLIGRGQTHQAIYELDMAMKDIHEANRLTNENNPYYLCCRASVHASKHQRDKAVEDIERASQHGCEQNVDALFQRGIVLAELDRHNAAIEDFKKAFARSPKVTQQSDIYYRWALSESTLHNREQAYHLFGRAINLHPYNTQALYRLGMMQTEKGQYKDALKSFNRAHELAPDDGHILLERATVHQHLGQLDDAANDRKRGMALTSTPFTLITMLKDQINELQAERERSQTSARNHFELAMAYHGLIYQKKNFQVKIEYYKIAVMEYRAAMQMDTKHIFPQACALLALCQEKMNNLIEAHGSHLEFYDILDEHKAAIYHWKAYLVNIQDKLEAEKLPPHLDRKSVSKLVHMELNRRKRDADRETFENDIEDKYKNQLIFYEQMRVELTDLLAAIALFNLESKFIVDNAADTANRAAKIVELISEGETSVPAIESALSSSSKVSARVLRNADYNLIHKRLKAFGNVGDMADQLDVAQLVARHLCTRYHAQLLCLRLHNQNFNQEESHEKKPSSSSWWNCCGKGKWSSPSKAPTFSEVAEIVQQISTFAVAFIIHTINNGTIRFSSGDNSARKDALATTLVLIVCQAHATVDTRLFATFRHGNEKLPISSTAVSRMLKKSPAPYMDEMNSSIEWTLYSFFHAPGIFYYSDQDSGKIRYYGSGPSMKPTIYGYRLGTREEVEVIRRFQKDESKQ